MTGSSVSLIIPCFNEAGALSELIDRLTLLNGDARRVESPYAQMDAPWDVLFVDDGSRDHTFQILNEAARSRPWLRVIRHPRNLGLGAALRTGFANVASSVVCTTDADGTCPLEVYPALVKLVQEGADVAIGSPWHPSSAPAECGMGRATLSRGASLVYRLAAGKTLHSWTSIARAYRGTALPLLTFRSTGFEAVAEILVSASIAGLDIREVPMKLGVRRQGQSKMKVMSSIARHLVLAARAVRARSVRRPLACSL